MLLETRLPVAPVQAGQQVRVTRGDLLFLKRLGHLGDEGKQGETGIDMAWALAALRRQSRDIIAGKV